MVIHGIYYVCLKNEYGSKVFSELKAEQQRLFDNYEKTQNSLKNQTNDLTAETDESEEQGYWIFHPKGSYEKKDVYECSHCGNFLDDVRFFSFCPLCGKEKNLKRTVFRYRGCTVSQSEDNHVTVRSGEGRVVFHEQNDEHKSVEELQKSVDNYFEKTWELLKK